MNLRPYQERIAEEGLEILRKWGLLALSMQVRTGKTLTALTIAEKYGAKHILFVTKKKAIASIENDVFKLAPSYHATVTNYENLHKVDKKIFDLIIVDESHSIGAYPRPSQRTKKLKEIAYNLPIIFLSGTPSPESYSQLYHQFFISRHSPWRMYPNFYRWADVFVNVFTQNFRGYPTKVYSRAKEQVVWESCKHLFLSITQEEAGFVAPVEEHVLTVTMQPHSVLAYNKLKENHILSHLDLTATVNSGADLINKLCQLSSGTLIYDGMADGRILDVSKAHFIQTNFAGKKIAIFYRYRAELDMLKRFYPSYTTSPEDFNKNTHLTFLSQIQAGREGVDLSSADALVMYNIDFSATSYWQARARIQSKERQGSAPLYWIFSAHGIERRVYKAVQAKKNFTHSYYKKKEHGMELRQDSHGDSHIESLLFSGQ